MKTTPGPWICRETYTSGEPQGFAVTSGAHFICEPEGVNSEQQEADARLIAAAPELLEALCSIVGEVREMCIFDDSEKWDAILGNMEVLIAKAEGR